MNSPCPKLDAELTRIGSTFARYERDEFLSYVWSTEFAEIDASGATTEEACKRANEVQARAAYLWDKNGDFSNCV
jgi:hypothetical protein